MRGKVTGRPRVIDARGLKCPLPVLRAQKALDGPAVVDLDVLADDPAARIDIPLLARKRRLDCKIDKVGDGFRLRLTNKSAD